MLVTPSDRQALFEDVFSQMHSLHTHWRMHVVFFGSKEAVAIISRHTRFTFGRIQALLFEAIVLGFDRLLAQRSSRQGQQNASVETLLAYGQPQDAAVIRELRKDLKQIRKDCQVLSEWRNRVVAHRDLAIALEEQAIDSIRIRTIRKALEDLSRLLTTLSKLYGAGLPCDFLPDTESDTFDADALLALMRDTISAREYPSA